MMDQQVVATHGDYGLVELVRRVSSSWGESSRSNHYWLNLEIAAFTRRSLVGGIASSGEKSWYTSVVKSNGSSGVHRSLLEGVVGRFHGRIPWVAIIDGWRYRLPQSLLLIVFFLLFRILSVLTWAWYRLGQRLDVVHIILILIFFLFVEKKYSLYPVLQYVITTNTWVSRL
jgi:hypothetical protein